jgi:hypothetical protein
VEWLLKTGDSNDAESDQQDLARKLSDAIAPHDEFDNPGS